MHLDIHDFAKLCRLDHPLDIPDFDHLMASLKSWVASPGEVLVQEGEPSHRVLFVLEGDLFVSLHVDGKEIEVGQAGPGSVLGEVSFITNGPATATVKARSRSTLLVLTPAVHDSLLKQNPRAAAALMYAINGTLARRVIDTTDRLQQARLRYKVESQPPTTPIAMTAPHPPDVALDSITARPSDLASDLASIPSTAAPARSILSRLFGALLGATRK